MAAPQDHARATSVLFRLSKADKAALKRDAAREGLTVQALLEVRVLGRTDPQPIPPGRAPRRHQEEELGIDRIAG